MEGREVWKQLGADWGGRSRNTVKLLRCSEMARETYFVVISLLSVHLKLGEVDSAWSDPARSFLCVLFFAWTHSEQLFFPFTALCPALKDMLLNYRTRSWS